MNPSMQVDFTTLNGLHYTAQVVIEKLVLVEACQSITGELDKNPEYFAIGAKYALEAN